jgi:ferredoxin
MTCDLCNGKPLCVEVCTVGALTFDSEGKVSLEKKKLFFQKIVHAYGLRGQVEARIE